VALNTMPPSEHLSESELRLIDDIYREHGSKDQWQLRDWRHEHCGEWTPLQEGRARIEAEDIARNVGKSEEEVRRFAEQAAETNLMAKVLSWQ